MLKFRYSFWTWRSTFLSIALGIGVSGCGPSSWEDFQIEGDGLCRALARDLEKIHSHEELLQCTSSLKAHFERIVDLAIEARLFQQKHLEDVEKPFCRTLQNGQEMLRRALNRIDSMEGGPETLEKIERDALLRLDAFERKIHSKLLLP